MPTLAGRARGALHEQDARFQKCVSLMAVVSFLSFCESFGASPRRIIIITTIVTPTIRCGKAPRSYFPDHFPARGKLPGSAPVAALAARARSEPHNQPNPLNKLDLTKYLPPRLCRAADRHLRASRRHLRAVPPTHPRDPSDPSKSFSYFDLRGDSFPGSTAFRGDSLCAGASPLADFASPRRACSSSSASARSRSSPRYPSRRR